MREPRDVTAEPVAGGAADRKHSARDDGTVEMIISWLLRVGVWTSVATIVVGLIMLVATQHEALLRSHPGGLEGFLRDGLPGEPAPIRSYTDVLPAVFRGQAYGVITLGLLLLLLTPVLRVAVSIVAFAIERDYLYTGITLVVLCLLLLGILLGRAGG